MFTNGRSTLSRSFFLKVLCISILGYCVAVWKIAGDSLEEHEEFLLSLLQARADALIGTIEAGSRFFEHGGRGAFEKAFAYMGRQPGVAWIALVDGAGRIRLDSDPGLAGRQLYTPSELAMLAPDKYIKSRFSPDDREIFESWRKFSIAPGMDGLAIFVALSAEGFWQNYADERKRILLNALLGLLIIVCVLTMFYFIYNYRISRRTLEKARNFTEQIMRSLPLPVIAAGLDGSILLFNSAAGHLFEKLKHSSNIGEIPGVDWLSVGEAVQTWKNVREEDLILPSRHGDRELNLLAAPLYGLAGDIAGIIFILKDMTEVRSLRQRLEKDRHLAAVGKLAAGIAHEIRNPLGSICGFAEYIKSRAGHDGMVTQAATLLEEEARRLTNVVGDLLAATRKPSLDIKPALVPEIVHKAAKIVEPDIADNGLALTVEIDPGLATEPAPLDADKILQALLNLLLNAVQATPPGGSITIRASMSSSQKPESLKLEVADTGSGIAEENLKQIFTPYFTTRDAGTGLGLAIVRQIVESHGGDISVAGKPGEGATFTLNLPLAEND